MYPHRLLISIGLAAFIGSLVVFAPLRLLVGWLPETSPLRSAQVEGTLLEGRLQSMAAGGPVVWRWHVQPAWLLTLGLAGEWQLDGAELKAAGRFVVRPWRFSISAKTGELSAVRVGRMFGSAGIEADQPVYFRDVVLAGWVGGGISAVKGGLVWGPGDVRLRNRELPLALPALRGRLHTSDGQAMLVVDSENAPDVPLATATLDLQTRDLYVVVLQRGARLVGAGGNLPDDKPAFELRQPLL